jgi:hypothetical protein
MHFRQLDSTAGQTLDVASTIACVMDKWDEKEPDKGHKLVDAAMRCVIIPNGPAHPKFVQDCVGIEYTYRYTGGTGKYVGASGGGTYMYDSLTDTLTGGTFKGQMVLP